MIIWWSVLATCHSLLQSPFSELPMSGHGKPSQSMAGKNEFSARAGPLHARLIDAQKEIGPHPGLGQLLQKLFAKFCSLIGCMGARTLLAAA